MEMTARIIMCTLLLTTHVTGYDRYSTAYMQDSCTCSSISHLRCESFVLDPLPQGAGNVALSRTSLFFKEFYCEFTIQAPTKRHRVMMTVNFMDIPKTKGCKAGTLKIFDGSLDEKAVQLAAMCGSEVPQFSFRSNTDRVTLAYHQALSIVNHHKTFNLTFTYFRIIEDEGHDCNSSREFPCVNGLCIPRVLECDGWNNCGDRTDESMDYHVCGKLLTASDPMVGLAVGVTVASLLIIVMASLIAYSVQRRKGPFFHDTITMTTIQTSSDVNGNMHAHMTRAQPTDRDDDTDDVTTTLAGHSHNHDTNSTIMMLHTTDNPTESTSPDARTNMQFLQLSHLDVSADDSHSVASSTELYAMGLHRHAPPPSYNSLFPDA